jgi:Choline dehydrogenase and related flavoproteins
VDRQRRSPGRPKFVFNYLSTEEDRRDAVAAVKTTRRIIAQSAWNKCRDREVTPGPDVTSDEEILAHLRQTVGTQYHPCGTCRMGMTRSR